MGKALKRISGYVGGFESNTMKFIYGKWISRVQWGYDHGTHDEYIDILTRFFVDVDREFAKHEKETK